MQEFPDFSNREPIKKLKDWQDTSKASDGMPSFIKTGEDGSIYKIFLNYRSSSERKKELDGNNRYELLKDGNLILKGNDFTDIYKSFEASLKKENQK